MNPLFVHTNQTKNTTVLQNQFIDQYMASANGEYVKLYLYLLRCAQAGEEISFASISDLLDHTEKDIKRALAYWEKLGLLHLTKSETGWITDITFLDIPSPKHSIPEKNTSSISVSSSAASSSSPSFEEPYIKKLTPEKLAFLQSKEEFQQIIFIAEQYLGKSLDSMELSTILYFYDGLHFSVDLIEYLIEYCVSKGCGNYRYMQMVAMSWSNEGISTVAAAKQSIQYTRNYYSILRAFGIHGRSPVQSEVDYMSRWLKEYALPLDLIIEACNRTIERIHQPKFSYTERILSDWRANGIKSIEQLKSIEEQQKAKRPAPASQSPSASANNRFHNFHQRQYDFDQLEKQLLNAD